MRAWKLFSFDVRFQWRQRFYFVYLFVCSVYVAILHAVPEVYLDKTIVLLTFSDPTALGLLFAGGIVLLERDQGIWDSLFATPVKLREYLLAKCCSLSLLSLAAAYAIHLPLTGWPRSPFYFSLGILLTSCFFTLIGIAAALRSRSINAFLIRSQLYTIVFVLPLLGYLNVWNSPLYRLLPSSGSLYLLDSANRPITPADAVYAIGSLICWIALAGFLALRILRTTVRTMDGGTP